jgi:hypothetical protein
MPAPDRGERFAAAGERPEGAGNWRPPTNVAPRSDFGADRRRLLRGAAGWFEETTRGGVHESQRALIAAKLGHSRATHPPTTGNDL